ncbi:uncharacterized protein F5147DRAFT_778635 [Suillus discolor]|uniref:Uncharacterized protein n=1 Tax=Suillus discolor TaxID=1912936 RepID=A0A9P7EYR3_9AGAM|nr:uncharacterized protein F5147DRAFT_778635 [Suillus discolor]KAG2095737.1 hypothetical protein F5147DRAFT_778635 [Suillus discolor]
MSALQPNGCPPPPGDGLHILVRSRSFSPPVRSQHILPANTPTPSSPSRTPCAPLLSIRPSSRAPHLARPEAGDRAESAQSSEASNRADALEETYHRIVRERSEIRDRYVEVEATLRVSTLQAKQRTTRYLETRMAELEQAKSRLAEVENVWVFAHEDTVTVLANFSIRIVNLLADEDRLMRGHVEKIEAMDVEATSLRKMLKEAPQRQLEFRCVRDVDDFSSRIHVCSATFS